MKYLKISFLALLLLGFSSSCEDNILDEARPGAPTENQFMDSQEKFEFLIAGVYQKLIFFHSFNGGNYNHGLWLLPDDNLTMQQGRAIAYENFRDINSNTYALSNYYNYSYQLINRANTLLTFQRDDQYGTLYTDQDLKNHHRGEALFLRGYMYLNLWNFFGSAPLNLERIVNFEQASIPNSENDEALNQAIRDLEEASTLLQSTPLRQGGVWNETAYGMLGKALMIRGMFTGNQGDFSAALNAFNQITSRSLVANYADNFLETTENNEESLFETMVGRNSSINNRFLNNDSFGVVGDLGATWIFFSVIFGDGGTDPAWVRNDWYQPTSSFLAVLDENDGRYPDLVDPVLNEVRKYVNSPKTHAAEWGSHHTNPRILRYADILLLKAEAIVRTGGSLSEAIGLVNQIRERAGALPAGDPNATTFVLRNASESNRNTVLEWIFEERRIELAFEESHRWWDLRRRHAAGEINLSNFTAEDWGSLTTVQFSEHNLIYPFPESEIILNQNLRQNPGY